MGSNGVNPPSTAMLSRRMFDSKNTMRRIILISLLAGATLAQQNQNPSPMVEHTRAHPRLKQETPPGRREKLELGSLFIPAKLERRSDRQGAAARLPLFVHFHGGTWLPEVAASRADDTTVISISPGAGSSVYATRFDNGEETGT